jgi:hypothetical protein
MTVNLHVLLKRLIIADIFPGFAAAVFYYAFDGFLPVELQNYNKF